MQIKFNPPGPDTPGFLKRQREALEFRRQFQQADIGPEMVDATIDYLLPYVEEPVDRDQARDALMEATQKQILGLLNAVGGNAGPLAGES